MEIYEKTKDIFKGAEGRLKLIKLIEATISEDCGIEGAKKDFLIAQLQYNYGLSKIKITEAINILQANYKIKEVDGKLIKFVDEVD